MAPAMHVVASVVTELMPLAIGRTWIALDAHQVREVLGPRAWLAVPGAPVLMPGVVEWRRQAVALLDVGAALGLAEPLKPGEERRRNVIVAHAAALVAIPADEVREAGRVAAGAILPPRVACLKYCVGETEVAGKFVSVLDLGPLLDGVQAAGAELA